MVVFVIAVDYWKQCFNTKVDFLTGFSTDLEIIITKFCTYNLDKDLKNKIQN